MLAFQVYTTHARIALESGDLNEYNICASVLAELKGLGLQTSQAEFAAYKLLHSLYRNNFQEINVEMKGLGSALRKSRPVMHAAAVVAASVKTDYHRFFVLYNQAPHMSAYLMDFMVHRMRKAACCRIVRAYFPVVSIEFLTLELAFSSRSECKKFVKKLGAILTSESEDSGLIDTKKSLPHIMSDSKKEELLCPHLRKMERRRPMSASHVSVSQAQSKIVQPIAVWTFDCNTHSR